MSKKSKKWFLIIFIKFWLSLFTNLWGILQTPYQTIRRINSDGRIIQAMVLLLVIPVYTLLTAPIKYGFSPGWLYLVWVFLRSTFWTYLTYFIACLGIYYVGSRLGGERNLKGLFSGWAFSLVPTYFWFFTTAVLYVLIPPPRTTSIYGYLLSILFIAYSIALLWWKMILYYLTLRFACKLSLYKIAQASFILWPMGAIYSFVTYKLGIFKIPFI